MGDRSKKQDATKAAKKKPKEPSKKKEQKCQRHAALTIHEITFRDNHVVEKDTDGNFDKPEWVNGRNPNDQAPACYTRKKKVQLTAVFNVTTKPSSRETVKIKGSATFDGVTLEWTGKVTVNPSDDQVGNVRMKSNNKLPNQVAYHDTVAITWQMNPANTGWSGAGNSDHLFYITLGDPSGTPAYWTLLDVSCRAANGQTTEAGVVDPVSRVFNNHLGDGSGIIRKRDNTRLTYWNPDTTTAMDTRALLARPDGSGQCGSWAEFLIDMYKVQGINTGHKVIVFLNTSIVPLSSAFLVKNWTFNEPPVSTANSFTHIWGTQCVEANGIPGQGNDNPPGAFENHFIVKSLTTNRLYDPSYGAGPFLDKQEWENAAIDGLAASTTKRAGYHKAKRAPADPVLLLYRDQATGLNF